MSVEQLLSIESGVSESGGSTKVVIKVYRVVQVPTNLIR